ncbi:MAG TPA: hypothetical protein H9713_03255 [Candidatus Mediterraneibacter surreyensis]|nr:hypothetical protein [Candidatus Mediterraneibacter surreyensis]
MFLEVKQAPCAEVPGRLMKMIQTILDYSIQSLVQEPDFEELSESVEEDFRYLFGRAAVHSAIEELFELPYIERTVLCEAFENDSEFKDHINDASYSFRRIPENENKVLSNLCNALYDEVRSGLPAGNKTEFNVRLLQTQFAQTNGALGRVCPVCVRELVFPLGEGEVDHYFPRKKYPALALHPYNLLPICSDCNGVRMKHMKSPFEASDRGPGELRNVYLPYLRAARPEIEFKVSGDESRRILMRPVPGADGYAGRRIENMERLYHLGERWSEILQFVCDDVMAELAEQRRDTDTREEWIEKLRGILRSNAQSTRDRIEFVKGIYCGWLNEKTDQELENIFGSGKTEV